MIRRPAVALAVAATVLVVGATVAGAQAPPGAEAGSPTTAPGQTTTTIDPALIGSGAIGRIVPEPNSGREPTLEGERGTTSQLVVFLALVGGLSVIGTLVWRDSCRSRARRARAPDTPKEPVADAAAPDAVPETGQR